jgi:hypothetical protein
MLWAEARPGHRPALRLAAERHGAQELDAATKDERQATNKSAAGGDRF